MNSRGCIYTHHEVEMLVGRKGFNIDLKLWQKTGDSRHLMPVHGQAV